MATNDHARIQEAILHPPKRTLQKNAGNKVEHQHAIEIARYVPNPTASQPAIELQMKI